MLALYVRDVRLGVRAGGGALVGVLFFLAVVTVVPFGVGPDLKLLARIGPAILWIGALLASLLGLDRLFQADREDGALDPLILASGRHPLPLTVLVKCLAHWTASVLPLIVAAPVLGLFMNMDPLSIGAATLTLAGRHAGDHLHRRGRSGGRRGAAARRAAGLGADPAAGDPGADLRRLGQLCRRQPARRRSCRPS